MGNHIADPLAHIGRLEIENANLKEMINNQIKGREMDYARLTRENEAMRKALEKTRADIQLYGLDAYFDHTTVEAIARIDAALSLKDSAS